MPEPDLKNALLLKETGLLYEINRVVLNPLGFSLAVQADGTATVLHSTNEWTQNDEGYAKYQAFLRHPEIAGRKAQREKVLGYVVQPHPKPYAEARAMYEMIKACGGEVKCSNGHTILQVDVESVSDVWFTYGVEGLLDLYEVWRSEMEAHRCDA